MIESRMNEIIVEITKMQIDLSGNQADITRNYLTQVLALGNAHLNRCSEFLNEAVDSIRRLEPELDGLEDQLSLAEDELYLNNNEVQQLPSQRLKDAFVRQKTKDMRHRVIETRSKRKSLLNLVKIIENRMKSVQNTIVSVKKQFESTMVTAKYLNYDPSAIETPINIIHTDPALIEPIEDPALSDLLG
jgi:chromosome segregation ATPase